ncbi:MAG TPA: hypothetical protein VLE20_06685, partial [Blastocatellia bacterium]|nr:hypothetical protein [Blastocatellia bacterium]
MRRRLIVMAIVAAVALAGLSTAAAAADDKDKAKKPKSLYSRLGGKKAITNVVEEFVNNCAADTRINKFFAATAADEKRLRDLKRNLVDQI